MAEGGDKKHEATQHRRDKAREDGQLARSQDLGSAVVLMGAIGMLMTWGPGVFEFLSGFMKRSLSVAEIRDSSADRAVAWVASTFWHSIGVLLPIFASAVAVAWVANWVQVGFLFLPNKITLNWSHINPLSGLQRMFSMRNLMRVFFGVAKIILVASVASMGLWSRWATIMHSSELETIDVGELVWTTTIDMCFRTALVLLVLAVLDYGFQRWRHEEDLKMTDEEMREEMKMMNGDPQIAARRKAVHRQLLASRMASSVKEADVVVTNPTELAIAIKFDPATMPAPIVVAKGSGTVAARIRKIALENGVPVLERKPLAQALFKSVEVGRMVPLEQFAAVAEVLRYVYQLQGKKLPDVAA